MRLDDDSCCRTVQYGQRVVATRPPDSRRSRRPSVDEFTRRHRRARSEDPARRVIQHLEEICGRIGRRMETIVFGPADFAGVDRDAGRPGRARSPSIRRPTSTTRSPRSSWPGRAQRSAGDRTDVPEKIKELDALRDYAMRTRILGYDGPPPPQVGIDPDQVPVINDAVFNPHAGASYDHAFDILDALREGHDRGRPAWQR